MFVHCKICLNCGGVERGASMITKYVQTYAKQWPNYIVGLQTTCYVWFCSVDQPHTAMPPHRSNTVLNAKAVSRRTRSAASRSTTLDACVIFLFCTTISHNDPVLAGTCLNTQCSALVVRQVLLCISESMPDIIPAKKKAIRCVCGNICDMSSITYTQQ